MTSSTGPEMRNAALTRPKLAFPALLGANILLAGGPWFVRTADTGPIAAAFWRMALALPLLILLAVLQSGTTVRPSRRALALIIGGGIFFAADLASWHLGIMHTKLANAALFGNSSSLILPLAGIAVTRIWPSRLQWLALGMALAGALILMGGSYELASSNLIGDLLCLLAGVLYVGYLLSIQVARRTLPAWWILALSTAASAPLILGLARVAGEKIIPDVWWPVIALSLTCQFLGQGMMVFAIAHFSPLIVGLALLTQPAVASVIGWAAFGERLGALDMLGMAVIGCALIMIRLPEKASRE